MGKEQMFHSELASIIHAVWMRQQKFNYGKEHKFRATNQSHIQTNWKRKCSFYVGSQCKSFRRKMLCDSHLNKLHLVRRVWMQARIRIHEVLSSPANLHGAKIYTKHGNWSVNTCLCLVSEPKATYYSGTRLIAFALHSIFN